MLDRRISTTLPAQQSAGASRIQPLGSVAADCTGPQWSLCSSRICAAPIVLQAVVTWQCYSFNNRRPHTQCVWLGVTETIITPSVNDRMHAGVKV